MMDYFHYKDTYAVLKCVDIDDTEPQRQIDNNVLMKPFMYTIDQVSYALSYILIYSY